jgi:Fic family protein
VPALVRELVEEHRAMAGAHPVERAARLHWRLLWVHPFVDGNGRTARLAMNFSLMRDGYPPAVIRKEDRQAYLRALEESCSRGEPGELVALVAERAASALKLYLRAAGA